MMYYALKIILSAVVLVLISEISRRSHFWGALLASLPIVSIFAFIWIYLETRQTAVVAHLSWGIAWLVLPSLILFFIFPFLLHRGFNFWLSLILSSLATAAGYGVLLWLLKRLGVEI